MQANEGVGPNGEVEYRYRRYYGAAFVQDDIKVSPRFTANLGLRWEYIGPSLDEAGTIGNVSLGAAARRRRFRRPVERSPGTRSRRITTPTLVNPYTGEPFGPPPAGVAVRSSKSFYENGAPHDKFAPRLGFAWQPFGSGGRLVVGGGYGWFFQNPPFSGNAVERAAVHVGAVRAGIHQRRFEQQSLDVRQAVSHDHARYVPRTLTSQLSDRAAGPEYRDPAAPAVEPDDEAPAVARRCRWISGTWARTATGCCSRAA